MVRSCSGLLRSQSATLFEQAVRVHREGGQCPENIYGGRQTFQLEPQLVDTNLPQYMMLQPDLEAEIKNHKFPGDPKDRIRMVQAVNSDYINSGYDKGHLNPCADHPPGEGQTATFTFTNVAPMALSLNRVAWRINEMNVRNIAPQCKIMYVITGVIPGDDWIIVKKQKRINIPSYIWSAFCCLDNNDKPFKAQGFMAKNENNLKVNPHSISDLQSILVAQYKIQNIILFQNNCK
ncbi:endonuclease domain-containing 1 protein-like [Bombina bombina]|uniref:endonuclease domain-containing 1 protein-like n=1 Tax=Bombina bombina TaxID=8345 RepID=UPI00235A5827|nr:endonuclease domain-containing 1 protein-like [Bombina bombina]